MFIVCNTAGILTKEQLPSTDQLFSPGRRRKLQEAFPELGGVFGGGQAQGGGGEPSPSQYSRGGGVGPAHYAAAVGYQGVRAGQVQGMGRDSRDRSSSRLKAVSGTFSGYNEGGSSENEGGSSRHLCLMCA